jgi:predicted acylesterase/phospholipase RssA
MQYDLVFEGGGAKGMVFVGAMQVFEAQGHTPGRLLGTSAGAITAALLAAGYRSQEMLEALGERRGEHSIFADFMSSPDLLPKSAIHDSAIRALLRNMNVPFIPDNIEEKLDDYLAQVLMSQPGLRNIVSFIELGGWFSANNFLTWLRDKLDTGLHNGQPRRFSGLTLGQFYQQTQVDLSLVGADTKAGQMLVLNHRTAPDLPLVWAVRMSMSLPLVWQEVVWQSEWGRYMGEDMLGHTIVDGGLLSNFPLELFVSTDKDVLALMGPTPSERVLGMLIDESLDVPGTESSSRVGQALSLGQLQTTQRISNLINTTLSARDKMVIDAFRDRVVRLPAKGYGTTEFDMTEERRGLLVKAGRDTMQSYFDQIAASGVSFDIDFSGEGLRAQQLADKLALRILKR